MNQGMESIVVRYNASHPDLTLGLSPAFNGRYVIKIFGRLDLETSTHIKPILDTVITMIPAAGHLTLDLEHVAYISSTGVGLLTTLLSQTKKQSIGFSLARVQIPVLKVMDLLGFSSFIEVEVPDA